LSDSKNPIVRLVELMLGEKAGKIFEYIYKRLDEVQDEEIARELGLKLNEVRKLLYQLSEQGLVSYRRVRDKSTSWYTYYWRVRKDEIPSLIQFRKKITLSKLKLRLKAEESTTYYECPVDKTRYSFDEALENEFRCPRCGSQLVYVDNSDIIDVLKKYIALLEREIAQKG